MFMRGWRIERSTPSSLPPRPWAALWPTRRARGVLYENLVIETNVIHAAWRTGVKKLLFLGSSCIYPRMAQQPMREEALLTGPLEPTNEWYAIAKIAGIKLCAAFRRQYGCDFVSVMPTNLYGPGDRYDAEGGHVVAALIMKIHAAKSANSPVVELWGSGTPNANSFIRRIWPTLASS
jgi:GDP-L-fucose synthase